MPHCGCGEGVRGEALGQRVKGNDNCDPRNPSSSPPPCPRGREEPGAEPNCTERRKERPAARSSAEEWSLQSLHHGDHGTPSSALQSRSSAGVSPNR